MERHHRPREFVRVVIDRTRVVKLITAREGFGRNHQTLSGNLSTGRGSGGSRESICVRSLVSFRTGTERIRKAHLPGSTFPRPGDPQELCRADAPKPFLGAGVLIHIIWESRVEVGWVRVSAGSVPCAG